MNNLDSQSSHDPQPQLQAMLEGRRRLTIGLPCCDSGSERRFPLTPEAVHMLTDRGFTVKMEEGAARVLRYPDTRYQRHGARIVGRGEALGCDIVIHLAPLAPDDARRLRRGAVLMTFHAPEAQTPATVLALLRQGITAIALDRIVDDHRQRPFADILAEIDGQAALTFGAALMADPALGKGILPGGVPGVVPCEVMVVGASLAGCAAAKVALGLGATVRMFDDDVYRLRQASHELRGAVICSALHPHVVAGAMRSADIVVAAGTRPPVTVDSTLVEESKAGVLVFDIARPAGRVFPSLPQVDAADDTAVRRAVASERRFCLVNPGGRVARTAAMALSNTLLALFETMKPCGEMNNVLRLLPGVRRAVYTFRGKVVDAEVARIVGMQQIDINIFMTLS